MVVGFIPMGLVGQHSFNFPGTAMFNYVLYGTSDAGYTYNDFVTT